MTKNTGGQAFPSSACNGYTAGMTLRDYFAGQALAGFMNTFLPPDAPRTIEQKQATVGLCYGLADAMLKERDKS